MEGEHKKRDEIYTNFTSYYDSTKTQMDEEQAQQIDKEDGKYLIEKDTETL